MKKILILLFVVLSLDTYGQFYKGEFAIGLQGNYNHIIPDKSFRQNILNTSIYILPILQYWISNKFSAGIAVGYNYSKTNNYNYSDYYSSVTRNSIPIELNVRYWYPIKKLNNQILMYCDLAPSISFISANTEFESRFDSTGRPDMKGNGHKRNLSISAGIFIFISERFGLDINLGGMNYNYSIEKGETGNGGIIYSSTIPHTLRVNFSPAYWRIGAVFKLYSKIPEQNPE